MITFQGGIVESNSHHVASCIVFFRRLAHAFTSTVEHLTIEKEKRTFNLQILSTHERFLFDCLKRFKCVFSATKVESNGIDNFYKDPDFRFDEMISCIIVRNQRLALICQHKIEMALLLLILCCSVVAVVE